MVKKLRVLDLKSVAEKATFSYEKKIENINFIVDTTHLILNQFQEFIFDSKEERREVNLQLQDLLAKNEHLRKKDFVDMIRSAFFAQEERKKEIGDLIKSYIEDQNIIKKIVQEDLEKFKNYCLSGNTEKVKKLRVSIGKILAKQEKRREEGKSKLKEFFKQQNDLTSELQGLLAKGNDLKLKDVKLVLKRFKDRQRIDDNHPERKKGKVEAKFNSFKWSKRNLLQKNRWHKLDVIEK